MASVVEVVGSLVVLSVVVGGTVVVLVVSSLSKEHKNQLLSVFYINGSSKYPKKGWKGLYLIKEPFGYDWFYTSDVKENFIFWWNSVTDYFIKLSKLMLHSFNWFHFRRS